MRASELASPCRLATVFVPEVPKRRCTPAEVKYNARPRSRVVLDSGAAGFLLVHPTSPFWISPQENSHDDDESNTNPPTSYQYCHPKAMASQTGPGGPWPTGARWRVLRETPHAGHFHCIFSSRVGFGGSCNTTPGRFLGGECALDAEMAIQNDQTVAWYGSFWQIALEHPRH